MTAIPVRWLTVFLDFPAGSFGAGVAFWAALTGWEGQGGDRSALPVRLELRRASLDDRVTGHLAFGCADRERLARRHAAAGARILAVLPRETEMADPRRPPVPPELDAGRCWELVVAAVAALG